MERRKERKIKREGPYLFIEKEDSANPLITTYKEEGGGGVQRGEESCNEGGKSKGEWRLGRI